MTGCLQATIARAPGITHWPPGMGPGLGVKGGHSGGAASMTDGLRESFNGARTGDYPVAPRGVGTLAENSGWAAKFVLAEALALGLAQAQELARCGGWGGVA